MAFNGLGDLGFLSTMENTAGNPLSSADADVLNESLVEAGNNAPIANPYSQPYQHQASLGQSNSTRNNRNNGGRLWNAVALTTGIYPPLDKLTDVAVEGDNLEMMLQALMTFVSAHPIPKFFKEDLTPRNPDAKGQLMEQSIVNYMGQVRCILQEMYPKHPSWPSRKSDPCEWYDSKLEAMRIAWRRKYLGEWRDDPDLEYGQPKTYALYLKNYPFADIEDKVGMSAWFHKGCADDEEAMEKCYDAFRLIDLDFLNKEALRTAQLDKPESFRDSFLVNFLRHMCGRGGEPRFTSWQSGLVSCRLQSLSLNCPSMKTLTDGKLPFVLSREYGLHCFFLQMALAIGPGQILRRTPDQLRAGIGEHIFPHLHSTTASGTSRKLTACLQANIPKGCPKSISSCITSRSVRIGTVTELSMHPASTIYSTTARTGHKTGNNSDVYIDGDNVERGYVGGQILAGNDPSEGVVRFPLLSWLPSSMKGCLDKFHLCFLEGNGVEAFKKGGTLHDFAHDLEALLIMRYNEIEDIFGSGNAFVTWMREQAIRCSFFDPSKPHVTSPVVTLSMMSTTLLQQFDEANALKYDDYNFNKTMVKTHESICDLRRENSRLKETIVESHAKFERTLDAHMGNIYKLLEKNSSLAHDRTNRLEARIAIQAEEIHVLKEKAKALSTPPHLKKRAARSIGEELEADATNVIDLLASPASPMKKKAKTAPLKASVATGSVTLKGSSTFNNCNIGGTSYSNDCNNNMEKSEVSVNLPPPAPSRASASQQAAEWNNRANAKGEGTQSIVGYLQDLHKKNWFADAAKIPYHELVHKPVGHGCRDAKWAHPLMLKLLDYVATEDDRNFLQAAPPAYLGSTEVAAYGSLSDRMMDQMAIFEGKTPLSQMSSSQRKLPGKKDEAKVAAVGRRVREYIKTVVMCGRGEQGKTHKDFPLMERSEAIIPPGTPEDTVSLMSFFGIDGKRSKKKKKTTVQKGKL